MHDGTRDTAPATPRQPHPGTRPSVRASHAVWAAGDAMVDGDAKESLDTVGGFEVEGGGVVVTEKSC